MNDWLIDWSSCSYTLTSIATTNSTSATYQRCGRRSYGSMTSYGCSNPDATRAPSSYSLVRQLSDDNALFLRLFAQSFVNMSTVGYTNIQSLSPIDGQMSVGKLGQLVSIDLSLCWINYGRQDHISLGNDLTVLYKYTLHEYPSPPPIQLQL